VPLGGTRSRAGAPVGHKRGEQRRRHFHGAGAVSRVPVLVEIGENYVAPSETSETRRRGHSAVSEVKLRLNFEVGFHEL
jgi:hypothetical protein